MTGKVAVAIKADAANRKSFMDALMFLIREAIIARF